LDLLKAAILNNKIMYFSPPGLGHQLPVATGGFVAMNMVGNVLLIQMVLS
jgi:hypothetical protein